MFAAATAAFRTLRTLGTSLFGYLMMVYRAAGLSGICYLAWYAVIIQRVQYRRWVGKGSHNSSETLKSESNVVQSGATLKISIVVPIYNPPLEFLQAAVESVRAQSYPHWELCLADDKSPDPAVRPFLEALAAGDSRIRCVFREQNGHISAASNSALELATGEFVALLDQDDLLAEDALALVADELQRHPDADMIFSDEDKIDESGQRFGPYFKPDWNWGQMLSHNMFSHLGVYRTSLLRDVGGFAVGMEGSQDYDLSLRCAERTTPARIRHIPHVLYHWRVSSTSTAMNPGAKRYAFDAGVRAIQGHLDRTGRHATAMQTSWPGLYRVEWRLAEPTPTISVVVWSESGTPATDLTSRRYQDFGSNVEWTVAETFSCTVPFCEPTFAEALDAAIAETVGEYVCLLDFKALPRSPGWLTTLVSTVHQPGVGVVGGKLVYRGRVEHASYVLTPEGHERQIGQGIPDGIPGPYGWLSSLRDCAAVSGRGLIVRRELLATSGGLGQMQKDYGAWDIGLGCVAHQQDMRVLWTPEVVFQLSSGTATDSTSGKNDTVLKRRLAVESTIYYSPNHAMDGNAFEYASPPRNVRSVHRQHQNWEPGKSPAHIQQAIATKDSK